MREKKAEHLPPEYICPSLIGPVCIPNLSEPVSYKI